MSFFNKMLGNEINREAPEFIGSGVNSPVANAGVLAALAGETADSIFDLPENHQVKVIGDFEGEEAFFFGEDSLGNGQNTMYMG